MIPRVKLGEKLRTSPINDVVDVLNRTEARLGQPFPPQMQAGQVVFCINNTGRRLGLGEIAQPRPLACYPNTDFPTQLATATLVTLEDPTGQTGEWVEFVVAGQDIADGYSGWGYTTGMVLARVEQGTATETDNFAQLNTGANFYNLERSATGTTRILWIAAADAPGETFRWALVKLGTPGEGAFSVVQATADGSAGAVQAKVIVIGTPSSSPNYSQTGDTLNLNYFKD